MISDAILNALLARRGWPGHKRRTVPEICYLVKQETLYPNTLLLTAVRLLNFYQMFTCNRRQPLVSLWILSRMLGVAKIIARIIKIDNTILALFFQMEAVKTYFNI